MMGRLDVRFDERGAAGTIAWLTVDNRAKLNTLNTHLMLEIAGTVEGLALRSDLRGVVLTGAGDRAFIGGADIGEMAEIRDRRGASRFIELVHRVCSSFRKLPVPVIARVNGYALGAGLEVAASCDIRIAAAGATFGMPEVLVGIPSVVEAALLPGLIGWGKTRRLLLLGETIGAEEALAWGLVERVAPPDQIDEALEEWIALLLRAGPHAVKLQKRLIAEWENLPMRDAIAAGIPSFADAWDTDEPRGMMRAFLDRPRPAKG